MTARGGRLLTLVCALGALSMLAALLPQPAGAGPVDLRTRWSETSAIGWSVTGSAPVSDAFQFSALAFAVEQVGNRVFVGGRFTTVTDGRVDHDQPYIAAFDARTGAWIESWRPELDGAVFDLQGSPDGSVLYVGGEFTRAGGRPRAALVALDPLSGARVASFATKIHRDVGGAPRVHALAIEGRYLYVGGAFDRVTGRGTSVEVAQTTRVRLDRGRPDPAWTPEVVGGAVWAVEPSAAFDRVYLGGLFDSVNGKPRVAFASVGIRRDRLTRGVPGSLGADFFSDPNGFDHVSAIDVVRGKVFLGGQNSRLLVVRQRDFSIRRNYRTDDFGPPGGGAGGDFQAIVHDGPVLFASCHCWGQIRVRANGGLRFRDVRSVIAFDARKGRHLRTFAPDLDGIEGAWDLEIARDGCLWAVGDFTEAGGEPVGGIVRQCPR